MEYLRPGHRQGLVEEQSRIDELLRGLISSASTTAAATEWPPERTFSRFFKLWALRQALGTLRRPGGSSENQGRTSLFSGRSLEQAQIATHGWGGELYFVYLPAEARYSSGNGSVSTTGCGIASSESWRAADPAHRSGFLPSQGIRMFPICNAFRGGHFSPAGYQLAAETILKALPPPAS
jgi:hypothetical protein